MKYLRKFNSHSDYEAAESSLDLPNVAYCKQEDDVHYKPLVVVEVTGVTINKQTLELAKGSTETLIATVKPANATNKSVTWASSNENVFTVSSDGLVTAVGNNGNATITVTTVDGGFTAQCTANVVVPVAVTGVTLNKSTINLSSGDSETLVATVLPNNAANKNVEWASSNNSVATVTSNGLVTVVGNPGDSATITVTTVDGGFTAQCGVTVDDPCASEIIETTYSYVDLGLPSGRLWANKNIGALTETDYGQYFQWGDTSGYTAEQISGGCKAFAWTGYKYNGDGASPSASDMTKYNSTDNLTVIQLSDDAAKANMGNNWRIASEDEYLELINNTNYEWTTINGVYGYKFINKSDSTKYIFLPAAGKAENASVNNTEVRGYYATSSINSILASRCLYFYIDDSLIMANSSRCVGFSVRAVKTSIADQPLAFTALEDGTFKFTGRAAQTSGNNLSYSLDSGETWTVLANGADSPTVTAGKKIMWKNESTLTSYEGVGTFSSSAKFNAEGNFLSILRGDNFIGVQNSTAGSLASFLFDGCTHLVSAENLSLYLVKPTYRAFYCMFRGCTNLTTAPQLMSLNVGSGAYDSMFRDCTSLTTVHSLPAMTVDSSAYNSMFLNCTSLTTAPELPATTLANYCYNSIFQNCTSLTTAPELPATTLANYCYKGMFKGCTSLTTAPELPAATVPTSAYTSMFQGCTSLTTAPELSATTLGDYCYAEMFYGCTSLNSITCLATDISATNCTSNWVNGVASNGTFTKAASMNDWTTGINGIPNNWEVNDSI